MINRFVKIVLIAHNIASGVVVDFFKVFRIAYRFKKVAESDPNLAVRDGVSVGIWWEAAEDVVSVIDRSPLLALLTHVDRLTR